jgi:hypothetical protein
VLKREFFSGGASGMGGRPETEKKRDFFLVVNTELIVYGATVPGSKLTIAGIPKQLNDDGTFSARFKLNIGEHVIPVNAKSADDIDERTITPVVTKAER